MPGAHKLVPVYRGEADGHVWPGTPEMLEAGVAAFLAKRDKHGLRETLMGVYNAMVAAAPSLDLPKPLDMSAHLAGYESE